MPCFWPVFKEGDPGYQQLKNYYVYEFKNKPYHYHNGGLWPMVNMWLGQLYESRGDGDEFESVLSAVREANQLAMDGKCFYEYISGDSGRPGGTAFCTWSAAAEVYLEGLKENGGRISF